MVEYPFLRTTVSNCCCVDCVAAVSDMQRTCECAKSINDIHVSALSLSSVGLINVIQRLASYWIGPGLSASPNLTPLAGDTRQEIHIQSAPTETVSVEALFG